MAISRTIPDHLLDQLYVPENDSTNKDLFTRNKNARKPIPTLGLDNLATWCSDVFQDTQKKIDTINTDKISVDGLKNQFLIFKEENELGAANLQEMLDALGALKFDGSNISEKTIYGKSIRDLTIQTEAYKDKSVTGAKIADATIEIGKTKKGSSNCILGGGAGDNSYREIVPTHAWQVPTIEGNNPRFEYVTTVWNQSPDNTASGAKLADGSVHPNKIYPMDESGQNDARWKMLPIGSIIMYPQVGDDLSNVGMLDCDGSAISRTTYRTLFRVIGTRYGIGDGSTTFNLPDYRGRTLFGWSTNGGAGNHFTQGKHFMDRGGSEYVTLLEKNMPPHDHEVSVSSNSYVYYLKSSGTGYYPWYGESRDYEFSDLSKSIIVSQKQKGSGEKFSNVPPFAMIRFLIKAAF